MDQVIREDGNLGDRAPGDRAGGPARESESRWRCTDCWGPAEGSMGADGRWVRIQ